MDFLAVTLNIRISGIDKANNTLEIIGFIGLSLKKGLEGSDITTSVKMAEILGESPSNWNDAVHQALGEASKHVRNITGVEVLNLTVDVAEGRVNKYKANIKIAYTD